MEMMKNFSRCSLVLALAAFSLINLSAGIFFLFSYQGISNCMMSFIFMLISMFSWMCTFLLTLAITGKTDTANET